METLDKYKEKAIRAHNWTSFNPEKRGEQIISDYNQQLMDDLKELSAKGIEDDTLKDYTARYHSLFLSWIHAKSKCASSVITGGSGFNVARANKANRSEERHYEVFQEWRVRAKKAIVRKSLHRKTYTSEIERYRSDLASLKLNHEKMKEANKLIAKAKKEGIILTDYLTKEFNIKPHMIEWTMNFGFGLANNNSNIKRIEHRIKELEIKEERRQTQPEKEFIFEGGKVVINYEVDRIQILFDHRPAKDELKQWKAIGLSSFKWSPLNKAWQRKITNNAIHQTRFMLKSKIKSAK